MTEAQINLKGYQQWHDPIIAGNYQSFCDLVIFVENAENEDRFCGDMPALFGKYLSFVCL